MATDDIFSADPVEPTVTLADLVGEDKKYKSPDDVAKAYAHAEGHIRNLERDLAALRAEKDVANNPNPTPQNPDPGQVNTPTPPVEPRSDPNPRVDENDFRSRIREEVKALNEQSKAADNIETVASKLVQIYGDTAKASEAVRRRAQELGVSVEWLRDSSARSPSAFYATMGITTEGPTSRTTPAPHSEVNTNAQYGGKPKNFDYYDNIRKEDPKLYFSAAMQREMQSQAKAQGSDFYKR